MSDLGTRNRAPLNAAMAPTGGSLRTASLQYPTLAELDKTIHQGVDHVREAAQKANPAYGSAMRQVELVDTLHMTDSQIHRLAEAARRLEPDKFAGQSDAKIANSMAAATHVMAYMPGTNMILYKPLDLLNYSPEAISGMTVHEFGHYFLKSKDERAADHIAAEILGPQAVVNTLKEIALNNPHTNDIGIQQKVDHSAHGTDYQRAVNLKDAFPKQHVDLSGFPKPTGGHAKATAPVKSQPRPIHSP